MMTENSIPIILEFDQFTMEAVLFDTSVGRSIAETLPATISLTSFGNEVYGPIDGDHGESTPVPTIPAGGVAYSRQGSFFCIFFGQDPAWPVDHVGQITGDQWQQLNNASSASVIIRIKD